MFPQKVDLTFDSIIQGLYCSNWDIFLGGEEYYLVLIHDSRFLLFK